MRKCRLNSVWCQIGRSVYPEGLCKIPSTQLGLLKICVLLFPVQKEREVSYSRLIDEGILFFHPPSVWMLLEHHTTLPSPQKIMSFLHFRCLFLLNCFFLFSPPPSSIIILSVWASHLSLWHLMWSGASPNSYSHWLIKTHMRVEDWMWRERSGLLSEGLITHSHWVACSLSHSWLSAFVCVYVKRHGGCDGFMQESDSSVSGIDCKPESADLWVNACSSVNVHSWVGNIQLVDDRFRSGSVPFGNMHSNVPASSPASRRVVQSATPSGEVWGSNRLINFSLNRFFFFKGGIGRDE